VARRNAFDVAAGRNGDYLDAPQPYTALRELLILNEADDFVDELHPLEIRFHIVEKDAVDRVPRDLRDRRVPVALAIHHPGHASGANHHDPMRSEM
jgi:hypothetical protein